MEIKIKDLNKIAKKYKEILLFDNNNIYCIITLSLCTTIKYSREINHLHPDEIHNLTIEYIKELISFLERKGVIDHNTAVHLDTQYYNIKEQIPSIIKLLFLFSGLNILRKK